MKTSVFSYNTLQEALLLAYDAKQEDKGNRTDNRYYEAVEIETGHSGLSEEGHNPSAHDGAHDTDDDIEQRTLLCIGFHDDGGDPACQSSKDDPKNDTHMCGANNYMWLPKEIYFF